MHSLNILRHKWVHSDSPRSSSKAVDYVTTQEKVCLEPKSVQITEFVTESMFKKFRVDQNLTMMAIKKSSDALNNLIYVEEELTEDSDSESVVKQSKTKRKADNVLDNAAKRLR